MMPLLRSHKRRGGCMKFFAEYWALFIKMLLLTKRKRTQTIVECLLAYIFLALLLAMRYMIDRSFMPATQMEPFRPFDNMEPNSTEANKTYYYPNNPCTETIMRYAVANLTANVPDFPDEFEVIPNPDVSALPDKTLAEIFAYIYFTNINDSCTNPALIPDQVEYTLRMQETGLEYYRAQQVKIPTKDLYWKRSPEDYCQDTTTTVNYTTQFLGVQYFVDLAIIQYSTGNTPSASSVYMNHFGCPPVHIDALHVGFSFFVPLFFVLIYFVTFLLNLGYIVEERANKTKEYLRIFGLRTWVNNLVWITRSMFIYFILTCICAGLSVLVLPKSRDVEVNRSKAVFNYVHWTLIWVILFVYSIEVSAFAVFFGQLFKRPLLAKLLGAVVWIITFIDFYPVAPLALRYVLCLFPNTGLFFCIQILQQYERRSGDTATLQDLYTNIFDYPFYIGICLLLMLVYSVIYFLLAIYVERLNPGEFGVSQPWNYLCKRSHSKSSILPLETNGSSNDNPKTRYGSGHGNHWLELSRSDRQKTPAMSIDHLNKKFGKFYAVTDLSLDFYEGEVCTLLGHNGAGKTTTTFILVGMLEPTSGRVTIQGLDNQLDIEEIRHYLGFCPQYDILYDELTVQEHLELIAKMRQMDKEDMRESIDTILQLVSLNNDRQTLSKDLSGGMKRRLSIGISLINDPKVIILDEPTSGIDPYNRRLIWTIIRNLKLSGKCVLLTTHFLEEADVLSDRIAIMSRGRLQASGTPDFLKQQTEFEYRLSVEKQDQTSSAPITQFVQSNVGNAVLERESAAELVYGIRRGESKHIERLITALDQQKQAIGINSYGLSMTTIEDVFLKLVQEEEAKEQTILEVDDRVFRRQYERVYGAGLVWTRIKALLLKRWHVSRRQISLFLGFFLLTILVEIMTVGVVPTPQEIQATLLNNERVIDAQVTLIPSIYNPHTIVTYTDNDRRLIDYLTSTGASIDEINTTNISNYVRDRYHQSADIFINKYQLGAAAFQNESETTPALQMDAYFHTVNLHTMPTSLGVAATNLFQFYANSSNKRIVTTNQPIITNRNSTSYITQILAVLYCFEVFPVALFSFLNSIIVTIFIGILLLTLVTERLNHSKDLQLLTNLNKRLYWISNWIFDFTLCLILIALLTIIVKIGAEANPKTDSEVHNFKDSAATGYFFLMLLMYVLASLPFVYVFSFIPDSAVMGFTNFFILNVVISVIDAVAGTFPIFSGNTNPSAGPASAILLPSVNFKHTLANVLIHNNKVCIRVSNTILGTSFSENESWMSIDKPGIGEEFIIFCVQSIFWSMILILIENRLTIRQARQRLCASNNFENNDQWEDRHLDEDVRRERQTVFEDNGVIQSSVVLVRDLVKKFEKKKFKSSANPIYYAVNHLNFQVQQRACFGLLGANGAGKTTTFRMLINDIKPSAGDIIINGININESQRDLEIGFCPQFDWLVVDLSVSETFYLFARLKGIDANEIPEMCDNMIKIFGLDSYEDQVVQSLSGGNKRKVSAALAFMANPSLVFLDEPTTGLDAAAKRKLWKVVRAARDVGLTIIMTSHSMEECEALCTKIGIMKTGQFMCLGNLQRLRNRFGNGYAVQVKVAGDNMERLKEDLISNLPGIEIQNQHNEVLFCNVPFTALTSDKRSGSKRSFNLAHVFQTLNARKEQKMIESYSVTQTTLEQIFVQIAGEDEDTTSEPGLNNQSNLEEVTITRF